MKKICKNCHKEFEKPYNESKNGWLKHIFCCRKCANEGKKGKLANNALGVYYQTHPHKLDNLKPGWNKGMHWSEETKAKMSEVKKGICFNTGRTHFKKGMIPWNKDKGLLPISEKRRIRSSIEYGLWRNAVFARDGYTCQKTGIRGGNLVAHHIDSFANFPEIRLAIDNGITLSKKAHRDFHVKYGFKNNTREQLLEFLNN